MIKLTSLKLNTDHKEEDLFKIAAAKLKIQPSEIVKLEIKKRSIEARKKEKLGYVYSLQLSLKDEKKVRHFLNSPKGRDVMKKHSCTFIEKEESYEFPFEAPKCDFKRPVIVGSGPAGLLCAYELAAHGFKPLVVERGLEVERRAEEVEKFWKTGVLNTKTNVQFGEGGAGTFSDGKLNTGVNDKNFRRGEVFDVFVKNGAPGEILYDALPHIGTDRLQIMVANIRKEIISLGGEFRFDSCVTDIKEKDGAITGVVLQDGTSIDASHVVFAIGDSARDTFIMLKGKGIVMTPKAFAVGVRVEHDQEMINLNQWGEGYDKRLKAAPYKLTYRAANGRSVYSFCMCPGGFVVNASSEEGRTAVNGMSYYNRDSGRANSAVIVSVSPEDYAGIKTDLPSELKGMVYQRELEEKAYIAGKGSIPAQLFKNFKENRTGNDPDTIKNAHKGKITPGNIRNVLPDYICEALLEGMERFDGKIKGFGGDATILYAVESRTSSPVRIERDDSFQSSLKGLFPCGEGAGYAGGITSAAIDGIKTAEAVAKDLCWGIDH